MVRLRHLAPNAATLFGRPGAGRSPPLPLDTGLRRYDKATARCGIIRLILANSGASQRLLATPRPLKLRSRYAG